LEHSSLTKYRNKITEVDGIKFHSKKEAARYQELKLLHDTGVISELQLQVRFPIVVNGKKICTYIADFTYFDRKGKFFCEDVKGILTPTYRLKKKLVEALYPFGIFET